MASGSPQKEFVAQNSNENENENILKMANLALTDDDKSKTKILKVQEPENKELTFDRSELERLRNVILRNKDEIKKEFIQKCVKK